MTACVFIGILSKDAVASQLDAWRLLPRPERLTELYFIHNAHLPVVLKPGKTQAVGFTIHNLEHQTTTYRYVVAAIAPAKEQILGEGTATLAHDAFRDVSRTFVVPKLGPRLEIRISLEYSGIPLGQDSARPETQAIHYWVNTAP